MFRACCWSIVPLLFASSLNDSRLAAQTLRESYGNGVHAFHAGSYARARTHLDAVIAAGSQNPVAYYFRGLAMARQGMSGAAEGDYQVGASLEFRSQGRYDVGFALQRIQGEDRIRLERIRNEARKTHRQLRQQRTRQRRAGSGVAASRGVQVKPQRSDGSYRWMLVEPEESNRRMAFESLTASFSPVIPTNLADDPSDPFSMEMEILPIGAKSIQPARSATDKFVKAEGSGNNTTPALTSAEKQTSEADLFPALDEEKPRAKTNAEDSGLIGSILGALGGNEDERTDPFADEPESEASDDDPFGSLNTPADSINEPADNEETPSNDAADSNEEDDLFGDLFE